MTIVVYEDQAMARVMKINTYKQIKAKAFEVIYCYDRAHNHMICKSGLYKECNLNTKLVPDSSEQQQRNLWVVATIAF